ncbi:MAG: 2-succinyl-5-enolpyruvyl-6-hydroxy-3-cyclohexene-1-carboxylic-acid synthase [Prevotella sp.]|nr:2-succinyl-5-enolpyruvyl-6-hydroxy-3-cyclohexene-1-carboxylic-acid synthase [Prevotella sp.]
MSYSNKDNINLLTALLVAHHVCQAVVCPGSRNAPIVHNLHAHPDISCLPVTDERSAGFYALGMAQALRQPVVVCVTSGTALLNLAPAVAEAYYQHVPLIVVSADRPRAWIDQLDGQTLRQDGALAPFVCKSVSLPEDISSATAHWYANRMVNEALLASIQPQWGPVHINVPISEPLFEFGVTALPVERAITHWRSKADTILVSRLWDRMMRPDIRRPMVVFGQSFVDLNDREMQMAMQLLSRFCVTVSERLCNLPTAYTHAEEVLLMNGDDDSMLPDFVLYMGDMLVSKRMRQFLRRAENAEVIMVSPDGRVHDTTMHMDAIVEAEPTELLRGLLHVSGDAAARMDVSVEMSSSLEIPVGRIPYLEKWKELHAMAEQLVEEQEPPYSQMAAVRYFEQQLEDMEYDFAVHYANSSAVRLANIFAWHHVYVNRGVNGIEGTLSTAAGFSVVSGKRVFCVIGDLSFFYDQNALWNSNLNGNLRIILLNNGKGGIFDMLSGLEQSEAGDMVSGVHHTSAQGICTQNDIGYLRASNMAELQVGIVTLLTEERQRPMVLEIFTDAETDADVFREFQHVFEI